MAHSKLDNDPQQERTKEAPTATALMLLVAFALVAGLIYLFFVVRAF